MTNFFKKLELPFKEPKNNQERIENFRIQQKDTTIHPYTCGNIADIKY